MAEISRTTVADRRRGDPRIDRDYFMTAEEAVDYASPTA